MNNENIKIKREKRKENILKRIKQGKMNNVFSGNMQLNFIIKGKGIK